MTEPLARATFDFTLDDLIDVSCRAANHLQSVRKQRRRAGLFCAFITAVVMLGTFRATNSTLSPVEIAVVTSLGSIASAALFFSSVTGRYRRAVRPILQEAYGEGPHLCRVELHADRLFVDQTRRTFTMPWHSMQSARDDAGDLEFLSAHGAIVVRARAFANEADRAQFLALARQLAAAAKTG